MHFSTYLSFFQTSGSTELYEDNEIFVKQFKLFFFFFNINQKTFSVSCKKALEVHMNTLCPILYHFNQFGFKLLISGVGERINT